MSKKTIEYAKKLVSQMTIDEKISQMPVSYTHLDVYKRQKVSCIVFTAWCRGE